MFSRRYVGLLLVILLGAGSALGQAVLGRIVVSVTDSTNAALVGAKLTLVDQETGATRTAVSGADGKFVFLALQNGTYKLTASMQGFKTAVYPDIKLDLGATAELTAVMQVGELRTEVVVEAAAEVLQTQATAIEGSVQGRQLRGLPLTNRDVLDFVLLMPGAQQIGGVRQSSFEGLPKGALNITMDGINVQDNAGKSSSNGSYFTLIRPKQDAVEEISVTTGSNSAADAGGGAVQIKFVTRRGTNAWHGGGFEFFRDQGLNANTFFNKRPTPGGQIAPRPKNHLNQYGGSIGGPLIKNKLFVFNNFEDFRLPQSASKKAALLTTDALNGTFKYGTNSQVNLFTIAGAAGLPTIKDPTVMAMLNTMETVRTNALVTPVVTAGDAPFYDYVAWYSSAQARRYFNTTRVDYDINDRMHWNVVGQWNHFDSAPDPLNNNDPPWPIAEVKKLGGGQLGRRYSLVTSFNWTMSPRINYELRVGRVSAPSHFNDGIDLQTLYPNGYGFRLNGLSGVSGSTCTVCFATLFSNPASNGYKGLPDNRDTPILTMAHNVGYVQGKHTFNFGTQLDVVTFWEQWYNYPGVPQINIGASTTYDKAVINAFNSTTLPGSTTTDQAYAAQLYATLVGRISSASRGLNLDETTRTYKPGSPMTERLMMKEIGVFGTDSWRLTKTLTMNYGLRYEHQGPTSVRNNTYASPTIADVWGQSGVGNLFKPGTLAGVKMPMLYNRGDNLYNGMNGYAPSLGLAFAPNSENKVYKMLFGGPGKTVFRGGYAIAFSREGMYVQENALNNGPGFGQSADLAAGTDFLNTAAGANPNPLMLSQFNPTTGFPIPYRVFPSSFSFPMPFSTYTFQGWGMTTIDPKIRIPYVSSWSFGIQRELTPNTVVEARYVGNHGTRLWRLYNLNETNIIENGFLSEFQQAQINRAVCMADANCSKAPSFANQNLSNAAGTQKALPIMQAAFGSATSTWFKYNTFNNYIAQGQAGALANTLAGSGQFLCNMVGSSLAACTLPINGGFTTPGLYPANFFQVNPDNAGQTSGVLSNAGSSFYDALQVEVRRRMTKGLMIQGNYTWSKSLSDIYADSTSDTASYTTLRNTRLDKGPSPWDTRHTARIFWTWELPFGPGRRWNTGFRPINKALEGWEFTGIAAIQSGRVFKLTSGRSTVNQRDAGVVLNGMTVNQLQQQVFITKDPTAVSAKCTSYGMVFYLNPTLIDPVNCGANAALTTNNGILQYPVTPGQWGKFIYLYGPRFVKPDLTIAKNTKVTEQVSTRFEVRFFNAFNITNFFVGGATSVAVTSGINSSSFGRTSAFYQDISANQDQGPRMIELVLRVNF